MTRQRDGERVARARKALDKIWNQCGVTGFAGWWWGRKYQSPTPGRGMVLSNDFEAVAIYEEGANGPLRVKSFGPPWGGSLKDEVIESLKMANLIE